MRASVILAGSLGLVALATHARGQAPPVPEPAATPAGERATAAETLFSEGRALLEQGRLDDACPKLAESMRLDPSPGTGLNLGDCLERQGRTASAWTEFRRTASLALKSADPRHEEATKRADALEARLSRLTIGVDAKMRNLPGLALELDGATLTNASIDSAVPVDPGEHRLRASAPEHQSWRLVLVVPPNGGSLQIRVPALPSARPPPAPPPVVVVEDETSGALKVTGFALLGAGVAGVAAGTALGVIALDKNDESDAGHCDDANQCDAEGFALRRDARAAGDGATTAIVLGSIAAAAGTVVLLAAYRPWGDERAVGVALGPTAFHLEGSW